MSAARPPSLEEQVRAIREGVAVSRSASHACVRVSGDAAFDLVDRVVPADLFLRDGQIRHTMLLYPDATPLCDLYLCADDDAFILLADGVASAELAQHVAAHAPAGRSAELSDLAETHELVSMNGPFAWELLAAIDGEGAVGVPYLTFYKAPDGRSVFRAGKTGEFGYDMLVPRAAADALWERLLDAGRSLDVAVATDEALWHCQLENWFFNIHREGRAGLTPIELGLSWRVSFKKEFVGSGALAARRSTPGGRRVCALRAATPFEGGDDVVFEGASIGAILHAERSLTTGCPIGIGLLDRDYAHSGIDRYEARGRAAAVALRTVSAPFIENRSLHVSPQRHSYRARAEIPFPPPARPG